VIRKKAKEKAGARWGKVVLGAGLDDKRLEKQKWKSFKKKIKYGYFITRK
jgi:hypothetical protein